MVNIDPKAYFKVNKNNLTNSNNCMSQNELREMYQVMCDQYFMQISK